MAQPNTALIARVLFDGINIRQVDITPAVCVGGML